MDLLIYLTAALWLVSKSLDCYITQVRFGGNIEVSPTDLHMKMKSPKRTRTQ